MLKDVLADFFEQAKKIAHGDESIVDFAPIKDSVINSACKKGFWFILYIGSKRSTNYGLQIIPNKNWRDWPLVRMNGNYSCTIVGPNISCTFEFIKFYLLPPNFTLLRIYEEWADEFRRITLPMMEILGVNDGFIYFNEFIKNLREKKEEIFRARSDELQVEFWSHYAASEEHKFLRQTISRMMEDKEFIPEMDPDKNYGIWQTWLYHLLISRVSPHTVETGMVSKQLLVNAFSEPHCFDPPHWQVRHRGNENDPRYGMYDFAEMLVHSGLFTEDEYPAYHAIKGFCEKGTRYIGVEHAELAAVLDGRFHDPLQSWNALVNAAYWSGKNAEEPMFATWEAAIGLCKRNNWADAQYALEYQMGIYKEIQKEE